MSSGQKGALSPEPSGMEPIEVPEHERRLGRYRLFYELAAGGMATVYLARDEESSHFGRLVALKRIHRHLARDKRFIEMFLDEARIASLINHPNVCRVFDFGEAGGNYFIAMEYLVGEPFSGLLRKMALEPGLAQAPDTPHFIARLVADACEGLHAAHELEENGQRLDVVHRDVSPQNLFVCYDGTVRVVDFGVAKAAGRIQETKTGQLKGKLAYMAPEQIKKKTLDRRADVWALGVVLWEMILCRRLFKRDDDVDTLIAVTQDAVVPPSTLRPGLSPALDQIVVKALQRDPDARYASARELGRDLRRFLVEDGAVIGNAEVAEWMDRLFPDRKSRQTGMVKSVDAAEAPTHILEPSQSGIQASGDMTGPMIAYAETAPPESEPVEKERRRGTPWILLIAVFVVALGIGVGATMTLGTMSNGGESATSAPDGPEPDPTVPLVVAEPDASIAAQPEAAPDSGRTAEDAQVTAELPDASDASGSRATQSRGRGNVMVRAPGRWATISWRGRQFGSTPKLIPLPVGPQRIVLRVNGTGPRIVRTVRVRRGETTTLTLPPQ